MGNDTDKKDDEGTANGAPPPSDLAQKQPDAVRKPRIVEEWVTSCGGGS